MPLFCCKAEEGFPQRMLCGLMRLPENWQPIFPGSSSARGMRKGRPRHFPAASPQWMRGVFRSWLHTPRTAKASVTPTSSKIPPNPSPCFPCMQTGRGAVCTPELLVEMAESLKTVGFFKEGSGGEGRNRTGGCSFCRAVPYHLATPPLNKKTMPTTLADDNRIFIGCKNLSTPKSEHSLAPRNGRGVPLLKTLATASR